MSTRPSCGTSPSAKKPLPPSPRLTKEFFWQSFRLFERSGEKDKSGGGEDGGGGGCRCGGRWSGGGSGRGGRCAESGPGGGTPRTRHSKDTRNPGQDRQCRQERAKPPDQAPERQHSSSLSRACSRIRENEYSPFTCQSHVPNLRRQERMDMTPPWATWTPISPTSRSSLPPARSASTCEEKRR